MERRPISIDEGICTLCEQCVEVCLGRVLEKNEDIIDIVKPDWCNLCGHCVAVCPVDAIIVGKNEPMPLPGEKQVTPEELMTLIRSRRSIRHYKKKPVPKDVIEQIIESARYAPTGANMQSIYFTVVSDPDTIEAIKNRVVDNLEGRVEQWEALAKAHEEDGAPIPDDLKTRVEMRSRYRHMVDMARSGRDVIFHHAPALILIHSDLTGATPKDDADLMCMCMMLMAESMGLGTCLIGLLNAAVEADQGILDLIALPQGHKMYASMILGYPELEFSKAPGRKPTRITWM